MLVLTAWVEMRGSTSNGRLSSVNGVWTSSQAIIKFSQSSSSAIDDVNALAMFIGDLYNGR